MQTEIEEARPEQKCLTHYKNVKHAVANARRDERKRGGGALAARTVRISWPLWQRQLDRVVIVGGAS